MDSEAQIRALDICILNLQAGEKLEQVLELYPQWTAILTAPLEAAQVLRVYTESLPGPQAVQALGRSSFLSSAQSISQKTSRASTRHSRWSWLAGLALVLLLLAGAFGGYAVISLALPGETLYPLKEMAWQARLLVAVDPAQRLELERAYDQARLEDIKTLADLNRQAGIRFAGLLQQNQPESWTVGGLPVKIPPQAQVVGEVQEGAWAEVKGDLQGDGTILVKQIRPREYTFSGTLQEISPEMLIVSGIPVKLTGGSLVHGSPMAGSQVTVVAFRSSDDSLLARLVDTDG
jgi:hypothetical protein